MKMITAKAILMKSRTDEWFGTDYTMNLYKGCHHGCVYCDSRSDCYQIESFDEVRGKEYGIETLSRELTQKRLKGVVGTGSMSDPYNFFERKERLTLQALELFDHFRYGVSVATKSDLVTRDSQLLARIATHSPVNVSLSMSTADDGLARKIERSVSTPSQRFEAIRQLAADGIYTGILLMPVLPYLTDDWATIETIIMMAADAGAKYIYPLWGMTLRDRQKEHYFLFLKRYFPELVSLYKQTYGHRYFCEIQNQTEIKMKFQKLCREIGIEYRMDKIIENYQMPYQAIQGTLF